MVMLNIYHNVLIAAILLDKQSRAKLNFMCLIWKHKNYLREIYFCILLGFPWVRSDKQMLVCNLPVKSVHLRIILLISHLQCFDITDYLFYPHTVYLFYGVVQKPNKTVCKPFLYIKMKKTDDLGSPIKTELQASS